MSRSHALAGLFVCGALGLADLGLLNLWLAPCVWPTVPATAATPDPAPVAKLEKPAEPAPVAKPEPAPVAKPEPAPVAKPEPAPVAKPEPAPVARPEEPAEPAPVAPRASSLVIQFETGASTISPADAGRLRSLVRGLGKRGLRIVVEGHADQRGETDLNQRLSRLRARAAAALIEEQVGHRIAARGLGSTRPLDPADTPEAWARNRRVEIRVMRVEAGP